MCAIAGYVGEGTEGDLERMVEAIRYRGPDDSGLYTEPGLGLGHARLSIIDLTATGHQPMWNNARTVAVVFNGEIYNFRELKSELGTYRFRGTSDTEVILALYERYGEKCFEKLGGMFAIALYDTRSKRLLLARDRMGKKPLYWGTFGKTLLFASEPKAILRHPAARTAIDPAALNAYFALDYVPTPMSIFRGINKLEPGGLLSYEEGRIEKRSFWDPDLREQDVTFHEARAELDRRLRAATRSRLISDVPLGVFLSGGLDSSTVAYYAAQESEGPIHTFSIGFDEETFDESRYAQEVADHLGTTHHHKKLAGDDSLGIIPGILDSLDEPLADASIIPTHLLSRFAKERVSVALGGDGGDELFAGYPTFQAERVLPLYRMLPKTLRTSLLAGMVNMLPASFTDMSLGFKLAQLNAGADEENVAIRHMRWLGTFNDEERSRLLSPEIYAELTTRSPYTHATRAMSASTSTDMRNKLLFAYQRTYLMDQVMVKVDRAAMYASLETRAPLLDHGLVEFADRLPYRFKLHGLTTKYLLKKTMEGKLPSHIINRRKKGFSVPVGAWLRGPLNGWAGEILADAKGASGGLLSSEYARTLWREHSSGQRNHRKKLWNLIVFLEWRKRFL